MTDIMMDIMTNPFAALADGPPRIVTLCGSTRFKEAFEKANRDETLALRIVLSVGCYTHSDAELNLPDHMKRALDVLHKMKIDMSDEILVLNVGGYIGESTASEIGYAIKQGKRIRYLEE